MAIVIRSLAGLAIGASASAVSILCVILLTSNARGPRVAFEIAVFLFICSAVGFLLVHLPSYLLLRSVAQERFGRILPVSVGAAFSFVPVVLVVLIFMSDSDNPRGILPNLKNAVSLETLPWVFGFFLGGTIFLFGLKAAIESRRSNETVVAVESR